ncbi:hypothetical protein V6N13_019904 [Hibiscus sabdariffa]|uniref:RRM domain-containing protein n=1 Tax=Hibiscus sabdariffa TaxID=183260 RepID=A0ABR1ZDU8_9ROSI
MTHAMAAVGSRCTLNCFWVEDALGHDDLLDAYVANKKDKQGQRFGFVRFSNQRDADRAIERLNGFHLYGFKVRVTVARFNARTTYWRRKKGIPKQARQRGVNQEEEVKTTGEIEMLAN